MRRASREVDVLMGLGVAVATSLIANAACAQTASSCAIALTIDATETDPLQLRQELAAGLLGEVSAPSCDGAHVSVAPTSSGLVVSVEQAGRSTSREVSSLHHAVIWIESWLAPFEEAPRGNSSGGDAGAEAFDRVAGDRPEAPRPMPHRVETRLELDAALSVGGDHMVWVGPELAAMALLTRAFWLGGGLGLSFWAQDDLAGVRLIGDVPALRVTVRGGGRLRFGERLSLDVGGGVGFTWDSQLDRPINPFAEVVTTLEVALGRNISFIVGIFARVHMIREANRFVVVMPDPEPGESQDEIPALSILAGELRLGFSYTFGRPR